MRLPESSFEGIPRHHYDALSREYERVLKARDILESKCRRNKEMLKEWREYCKIWIEKKGPRSKAQVAATNLETRFQEDRGAVNAPTPPEPPANITPTPPEGEAEVTVPINGLAGGGQQVPRSQERSGSDIKDNVCRSSGRLARLNQSSNAKVAEVHQDEDSRPTTANSSRESGDIRESRSTRGLSRPDNEDDDSPVFVSERTLKRKHSIKAEPDKFVHADKNIKIEARSYSPVLEVSCQPAPRVQDSLDLDDVGRSFNTPRKRQRLERMRLLSGYASNSKLHAWRGEQIGMQQFEPDDTNVAGKENQGGSVPAKGDQLKATSFDDRVFRSRISPSSEAISQAAGPHPATKVCHTYGRSSEPKDIPLVLGPKDPNALPRTSNRKAWSIGPSRRDRGAAHVPELAEDGVVYTPSKQIDRTGQLPGMKRSKALSDTTSFGPPSNLHNRLDGLLDQSSSAKCSLLQSAPNLQLNKSIASPKSPMSPSKELSVNRSHHQFFTTPLGKSSTKDRRRTSTNSKPVPRKVMTDMKPASDEPPEVQPDDEPLRARPLSHLRLSDFRLNNSHSEHAFHESIRKHDEKRTVGGCIDPFCDRCKEIARFTALTNFAPPQNTTLFGSSPPDPAAAEEALLLEYLGGSNDGKMRLNRMTPSERKETLQRAREKSFADLYGRHRQMHNRAVSPPGYWETEFPSTQQEMENREAAKAMEKVRVKERWEEALRGGMWKFADE